MLKAEEVDFVNELCELFSDQVTENTESIDQAVFEKLKDSPLVADYDTKYFYKSFQVKDSDNDSYILILKNSYYIRIGRDGDLGDDELQLVGIKKLSQGYGNILIRPETLEDKITELFISNEIDLEDYPSFSSRYYFLADNESKAYSFASRKRVPVIEKQKEIFIHVIEETLIAKYCRRLTKDDFAGMIGFLKEI